ncbi:hypothetical protein A0H81_12837 [Grifola frondosa]|uniref:Cdc23 domain-containing protein n=1 Tax=Grifola frondosa TaxID=5627 RepID=A0A1C7LSN8_GRIFR|nr:hypothetical protein A0H81_12837 [Grifola frondosa]
MASMTVDVEMVVALRNAVRDCSERGLSFASKWASELLLSVSSSKINIWQVRRKRERLVQTGQLSKSATDTSKRILA